MTFFPCLGYARLSNVEFYHTGQEGFVDEYDPRYSLAFLATGTVNNVKPSSVSKCSFHNGFSSAIGVFGTSGLNLTENVVFGAIGDGKYELLLYLFIYLLFLITLSRFL